MITTLNLIALSTVVAVLSWAIAKLRMTDKEAASSPHQYKKTTITGRLLNPLHAAGFSFEVAGIGRQ